MGDRIKRFAICNIPGINHITTPLNIRYRDIIIGRAIRTSVDKVELFIDSDYSYLLKDNETSMSMEVRVNAK